MSVSFLDGRVTLHPGDCLDVLRAMPDATVDSAVTDPPYALVSIGKRFGKDGAAACKVPEGGSGAYARASAGFMGKAWDTGERAFSVELWAEVLRVLKPGGHVIAFGGTRSYHRLACAIEDAGFEIRDQIGWTYGSGFPKSHNQPGGWGTALKPAWEPICLARKPLIGTVAANVLEHGTGALNIDGCRVGTGEDKGIWPVTKRRHDDVTFTLQPVETDRTLGRWPANIVHDGSDEVIAAFPEATSQQRGVGPQHGEKTSVNVFGDYGAREQFNPRGDGGSAARFFAAFPYGIDEACLGPDLTRESLNEPASDAGACLSLQSEAAVSVLSRAVGRSTPGSELIRHSYKAPSTTVTLNELRLISESVTEAIQSIARRCSLGFPPERLSLSCSLAECAADPTPTDTTTITISLSKSSGYAEPVTFSITRLNSEVGAAASASKRFHYSSKADADDRIGSKHPTVKPVDLMRWLVRLVTPQGGTVLDPFAGTGTTGEAAYREGFQAVLIEREAEYQADIARRMGLILAGPDERRHAMLKARGKVEAAGPLFAEAAE